MHVLRVKDTVQGRVQIQVCRTEIRGQLSYPTFGKGLKKNRNYNTVPRPYPGTSFKKPLPPPPKHADGDRRRRTRGRRELHRTVALKRTAEDTRHHGRAEAGAETPSVGAAPRAPLTLDRSTPPTTTAAAGSSSSIHPPCNRSLHRTLETRDQHPPPLPRTTHRRRATPVQKLHNGSTTSTGSPSTPELNAKGARKSLRGLIPMHRRRFAGDARKHKPRGPRT